MMVLRSPLALLWKGLNCESTFSLNVAPAVTPLTVKSVQEMPNDLGWLLELESSCSSLRISPARCHSERCVGLSVSECFSDCDGSVIVVDDAARLGVWLVGWRSDILKRLTGTDEPGPGVTHRLLYTVKA